MVDYLGVVERVLAAIFVILAKGNSSKTPDVTLIVQHTQASSFSSRTIDLWCVSNDSTAISWTTPTSSDYNGFPVYTTENRDGRKQPLQFLKIGIFDNNFRVSFSVKAKYQAQIFFCNGLPDKSMCYWFLIGGWDGRTSALRKCDSGEIPMYSTIFPEGSCAMFKSSVNHTKEDPLPLKEDEWRNFIVTKKGRMISLKKVNSVGSFLEYYDNEPIESEQFEMFVISRNVQGFWKMHMSDFLYTTKPSTTQLGPQLQPIERTKNGQRSYHLCLKMFVVICDGCFLTIRLSNDRNNYEKTFHAETKTTWQEIRYVEENLNFDYYTMSIITHGKNVGFWAVDDIRQCSSDEVRVVTTKTEVGAKISCQLLQYPSKILKEEVSVGFGGKVLGNLCPFGTFGQHCAPCDLVFGEDSKYCQSKKLCIFYDGFQVNCVCPYGYTGTNCDQECPDGLYGFSCSQECGNCYRKNCDKITGNCPYGCDGNYVDDFCKISQPILVYPPKVLRVGIDFCEVQLVNTDTIANLSKPQYYNFQISTNKRDWSYVNERYLVTDLSPKTIRKLNFSTIYYVRAVLESKDNYKYESEQIPFEAFETSCIRIKNTDLVIKPKSTSAVIILEGFQQMCPIQQYQIFLKQKQLAFVNNQVIIDDLLPYTNYTVTFYRKHEHELDVNFVTLDGVPGVINGVQTTDKGPNFISFRWNPPSNPNGKIRHYTIIFTSAGRISCAENTYGPPQKLDEIKGNHATLQNLEPYTKYFVEIYANNAQKGISFRLQEKTLASDVIDPKEIPTTINVHPGETSALIQTNEIPCQNQKGQIYVDITAECSNEWCKNPKNFKGMLLDNHPLKLDILIPYSDYLIKIDFRRPFGEVKNGAFSVSKSFRTLPGVPPPVRNLSVYSQTKNEAFLSWLPPYPPRGVLKTYEIGYIADGYSIAYRKFLIVLPQKCQIWHEKHCGVVGELDEYRSFHFQVFANNYDNDRYNIVYQATTPTATKTYKLEGSSKPKWLNFQWKNDEQLVLTWYHPDFTSGPIRNFQILIKSDSNEKYEHYTIANYTFYNLTYTYQVQTIFKKSTKYTISVSATTYINAGFKNTLDFYTPPEKPRLRAPPQILDTMNNTIKLLIPSYDSSKSNTNDMSYLFIVITEMSLKCPHRRNDLEIELIEQTKNGGSPCIVMEVPLSETTKTKEGLTVVIGHNQQKFSESSKSYYLGAIDFLETPLREDAIYNLSVLLLNEFESVRRYNLYRLDHVRLGQIDENDAMMDGSSNLAFLSFLLFLVVPLIIWVLKKKNVIDIPNLILMRNSTRNSIGSDNKLDPDVIPLASSKPTQSLVQTKSLAPKKTPSTPIVNKKIWSKPVKISDLEGYVKESVISGDLEKQHQKFPRGITKGCEYGSAKPNKLKNRYNNLIAYDHTRVKLEKLPNEEFSDYINANYVDGYKKRNAYIATQGPKISTLGDFWRMIWQEQVKCVVMLANLYETGKKKCEKYWPDLNESVQFGGVKIRYVSSDIFADYEYRVFEVVCGSEKRSLEQLHFTSWPDHGVPLYPQNLVPFLRKISQIEYDSPIVVHCSAGVGRTGTIILCDICLRMANTEGVVDFFGTLHSMREQRVNMVDNADQYKLAHLVLLECLISPCTSVPCNSTMKTTIKRIITNGSIEEQMEYLQNIKWQNEVLQNDDETQTLMDVSDKNRFQEITPDTYGRVFLQAYPITNESSTYINAVIVDGYRSPQKYIVTQQPLPNTVGDFWRLVAEKEISVIVSLNSIKNDDKTTCTFWPDELQQELKPVDYISLKYKNQTDAVVYQIINAHMQVNQKESTNQNVCIISMKDWDPNSILPTVPEKLLLLSEEVTRLSRNDKNVLVTCYDGATACGLFVSLVFVIEKIKLEHECDVCLAVRTVRRYRKQFVTNREQFKFLYEAALKYIEEFETYSNFVSVEEF